MSYEGRFKDVHFRDVDRYLSAVTYRITPSSVHENVSLSTS